MGELIRQKKYISTGSNAREKEDFTYTLFNDIDFSEDDTPISFFRSDFRGAKFVNVVFYRNNFDRADFISCVFIDCKFINVDIAASEMKNCYFQNVEFIENIYNNTSIQETTFYMCVFKNEKFLINMKNCKFIESNLSNCRFERSTTEKISYDKCKITMVDFANMHAERYSFHSCDMTDIDIDICYIFGYLFYNTNISGIGIIYMGDKIEFTKDNMLDKFASKLWPERRYHEFINANIIFENLGYIPQLVKKAFTEIAENKDYSNQFETLNIFEVLQFYVMNNRFNFVTVKDIIEFWDSFDWNQFKFEDRILYLAQIQKFNLYLTEAAYNDNFIQSAADNISFVTFYCNTDDYDLALKSIKNCLNNICNTYDLVNRFEIINEQRGSWIITIAVITACALILPKIFKKNADVIIEVNTKRRISRKITDLLEKKNLNLNEFKLLADITKSAGIITISKENQDSIDISDISKILEMIKIGV